MPPEKPYIYIDGQQQSIENSPLVKAYPQQRKGTAAFAIKYALLLITIHALLGLAFGIVFIGLFIISPVLILLCLLLGKEVYHDIAIQLESEKKSLAAALTICSFLTIFGAIAVLLFVVFRTRKTTSS